MNSLERSMLADMASTTRTLVWLDKRGVQSSFTALVVPLSPSTVHIIMVLLT